VEAREQIRPGSENLQGKQGFSEVQADDGSGKKAIQARQPSGVYV